MSGFEVDFLSWCARGGCAGLFRDVLPDFLIESGATLLKLYFPEGYAPIAHLSRERVEGHGTIALIGPGSQVIIVFL